MKKYRKNVNGITLIALVVTIIILLILAGISIVALTGENGLFERAKQARRNTIDAQERENTTLESYENAIDQVVEEGSIVSISDWEYDVETLEGKIILKKYIGSSETVNIPDTFKVNGKVKQTIIGNTTLNGASGSSNGVVTFTSSEGPFAENETIKKVNIDENVIFLDNNMRGAFYKCTNLQEINRIPSDTVNMSCAFYECSSITQIPEIPNSVTNMQLSFKSCTEIENIVNIPAGVTSIAATFALCKKIDNIVLPDTVTGIAPGAFIGCTNLKNIKLPNNLKSIGEKAFYNCAFTSMKMPDTVTSFGKAAFASCKQLQSFDFGECQVTTIRNSMLASCTSLVEIKIPDTVTEIGEQAFIGCTSLQNIELNDGLKRIEENAFARCTSLQYIYIPSSVVTIITNSSSMDAMLYDSSNIKTIYVGASEKQSGWQTYWNYLKSSTPITVKYGYTREAYLAEIQ